MRSPFLAALPLLAAGCATTPAPRPAAEPRKVESEPLHLTLPEAPTPEAAAAWWPPELTSALREFARNARAHRAAKQPGRSMPRTEVDNWRELLTRLDGYLARPGATTPTYREGAVRQT